MFLSKELKQKIFSIRNNGFRVENVSYGEGEGNEKKFFFECLNGEYSTNVKLSWKFKKRFPASPNGGDTGLL